MPKTEKTAILSAVATSGQAAADNARLVARVVQVALETVSHRLVRDKSLKGVSSRCARFLNKEGFAPPAGEMYFTGADIQALMSKAGTEIPHK